VTTRRSWLPAWTGTETVALGLAPVRRPLSEVLVVPVQVWKTTEPPPQTSSSTPTVAVKLVQPVGTV
jgi:hypothetical protein